MTIREQVYQAALAKVIGAAPPAGAMAVHDRMRMAAFSDDELPAIRVLPGLDQNVAGASDYENVNDLGISVEIFVAGNEQIGLLAGLHAEVHRRMWSDPYLGSLAVRPFNVDVDERRAESDRIRIQLTIRYRWRYRVAADDVTVTP